MTRLRATTNTNRTCRRDEIGFPTDRQTLMTLSAQSICRQFRASSTNGLE